LGFGFHHLQRFIVTTEVFFSDLVSNNTRNLTPFTMFDTVIIIAAGWKEFQGLSHTHTHTDTHSHFTAVLDFVWDYPGEPAPER